MVPQRRWKADEKGYPKNPDHPWNREKGQGRGPRQDPLSPNRPTRLRSAESKRARRASRKARKGAAPVDRKYYRESYALLQEKARQLAEALPSLLPSFTRPGELHEELQEKAKEIAREKKRIRRFLFGGQHKGLDKGSGTR